MSKMGVSCVDALMTLSCVGVCLVTDCLVFSPYNLWIAFISSTPSLTLCTVVASIAGAIRAEGSLRDLYLIGWLWNSYTFLPYMRKAKSMAKLMSSHLHQMCTDKVWLSNPTLISIKIHISPKDRIRCVSQHSSRTIKRVSIPMVSKQT